MKNRLLILLLCLWGVSSEAMDMFPHRFKDDTYSYKGVRYGTYIDTIQVGKGVRFMKFYMDAEMAPQLVAYWASYTWDTANGNINITNSVFGTLHPGDIVHIPNCVAEYRSFSFSGLGTINPTDTIHLIFEGGANIRPHLSPIFANSFDNSFGVSVENMRMDDDIDVAFASYASTGYSQNITFKHFHGQGMNGFFPSNNPSFSLPAFNNDTTKCFKNIAWADCQFDSVVGSNSGQTAIWIGSIATNQVWLNPSFIRCSFKNYSSASNPSNYLHVQNAYRMILDRDTFATLGFDPNPSGHASDNYFEGVLFTASNCVFTKNFGNSFRVLGNADLKAFQNYQGTSLIYNCIQDSSHKYAFVEQYDITTDSTTLNFIRARRPATLEHITVFNPGSGVGLTPPSAYKCGLFEMLGNDSVIFHNCLVTGSLDTAVNPTTGPFLYTFSGSGSVGYFDTSHNSKTASIATPGINPTTFVPTVGGLLQGKGITISGQTVDMNGNPWGSSPDIGAFAYINSIITSAKSPQRRRLQIVKPNP